MARKGQTGRGQNGSVRYAIYSRCSTDDQSHKDFSTIEVQNGLNLAYVQEAGGEVCGQYTDDGWSGTNLNRSGFQRLLADAQNGAFDTVVVTYMSRLGRGRAFANAEYELEKHGVTVEMVKEQFGDDMAGFINKEMTQFVDGMYVQQVRQWTKTKMEAMVKAGYVCGGTVPFGLDKEIVEGVGANSRNNNQPPKRFVPHPDERDIVVRAYSVFAETASFAAVQDYLKAITDRVWVFSTVANLLRNEAYRGVLKFGQWRNETAIEPIISPELWEAVRKADASRSREPKRNPIDDFRYALRGRVYCPHCGCKMTPARHTGRTGDAYYYECIHALKGKTKDCPVKRVNAKSLPKSLFREIHRAAQHPTRMNELIRDAVQQLPKEEYLPRELTLHNKRLADIDKQIDNLTKAIATVGHSTALLRRLESMEAERGTVAMRLTDLKDKVELAQRKRPNAEEVCLVWSRLTELWEAGTEEEQEAIMQAMVGRVEMDKKEEGTCEVALLPQVPTQSVTNLANGSGGWT